MTGTEGFVLFVIALCILYLLTYFIFFRRYVSIKDVDTTTTTTTTVDIPQITNNTHDFVDRNTEYKEHHDKLTVIENTQKVGQDNSINDVEMLDVSGPKGKAVKDATVVSNVVPAENTTAASNHTTNSTQEKVPLEPININHSMIPKTKELLETFSQTEKRRALYDERAFAYPEIIGKIDRTGTIDQPLCKGKVSFNQWNVNSRTLRQVVDMILFSMAIDLDNKRPYNDAIVIFINKFIHNFTSRFDGHNRPWGNSDLDFIDMMYVLMIFMITPDTNDHTRENCANIILKVITRPGYAFGKMMPMANVAHTSTPFIVAKRMLKSKILKGDVNQINNSILREYSVIPNSGFHSDHSFSMLDTFDSYIPNRLCSKYRYELLAVVIKSILNIDKSLTFTEATSNLNKIIIHPNIKIGTYGISTFDINIPKLTSKNVNNVPINNYGMAVMPLARVLRLFTKHYTFMVRGMIDGVKYMPDSKITGDGQTIPRHQLCAMQLRKPISDRDKHITYPDFGYLGWDTDDELSSMKNTMINQARSYVGIYKNTAVFTQKYSFYEPGDKQSWYYVEELIVIEDKKTEHILNFKIKIINSSTTRDLVYYGYNDGYLTTNSTEQYYAQGTTLKVPKIGGVKIFNTKLRIKGDKLELIEPTHEIIELVLSHPITLNDRVKIVNYGDADGYAMVDLSDKEPKVYCPSIETSIDHKDFKYDPIQNQWVSKIKRK